MRDVVDEVVTKHLRNAIIKDEYISACCPFHKGGMETRPSFWVSRTNGNWGCFSCHTGGKNLQALLQQLGISAVSYKVVLEEAEKEAKRTARHRQILKEAKDAADFRGTHILPEALLGVYDWTPTELVEDGFDEDLILEHDIGYDKERERITYPIRDVYGNLVGISGRQPDGKTPKYKVYTGWHKFDGKQYPGELGEDFPSYKADDVRNHLWRGQFVFKDLLNNKHDQLIVVEGYKAALWMVQCGWFYTVAVMGSMTSARQERLIRTMGADVWVLLDANEPGRIGSEKICRRLADGSFKVFEGSYGSLPEWVQPDNLADEELNKILSSAKRIGGRRGKYRLA